MSNRKQRVVTPLSWYWFWLSVVAFVTSLYFADRMTQLELLVATAAIAIIAAVTRFIDDRFPAPRNARLLGTVEEEEPEEFTIQFPEPAEYGWHRYTVTPSLGRYEEQICFGGPPTDNSTFEYTIKGDQVFARLLDLRVDDLYGCDYEVVNGQVIKATMEEADPDSERLRVERLSKLVYWREVKGALRYFILSKHGFRERFFQTERDRVQNGFASLQQAALEIGAVRGPGLYGCYEAPDGADESTREAVRILQRPDKLKRFRICFRELVDYEHIISTLDSLTARRIQDAVAAEDREVLQR